MICISPIRIASELPDQVVYSIKDRADIPWCYRFLVGRVLGSVMDVVVPIDGSECSRRALRHAVDVVTACTGSIDVVHFTDIHNETTDDVIETAETILTTAGVEGETEVITDIRVSEPRSSTHIGRRVLQLVEDREYDHVIMGHHGTGVVGELILGSTAKTVIEAGEVPVTVIP